MNHLLKNSSSLKLIKKLLALCLITSFFFLSVKAQDQVKRPNILFCIADDASWQHMSAYSQVDWVSTPNFDRVAEAGLLFTNAYTPNAKCAPSRASILTGRNPWQLEEAGNHNPYFPTKFTTIMEALGQHGYHVGYTGKGWAPGVAVDKNGEPRSLTGAQYSDIKKANAPTKNISTLDYAANFAAFLNDRAEDQPFMFWFGSFEPHRGYEYGSGVEKGGKKLSDIDNVPDFWMDNDTVRNDMLDYALEVEYFDKQLGKVLQVLEDAGELENTIIVVTSDNGMPFPRVKGHVYEYDNHLPLAIMWKGQISNPGRVISEYVSFIDFAPTFLDLAGLNDKSANMQPVQGKSLLNILKSKGNDDVKPLRDFVLLGRERTDVGRPQDRGYPVRAIVKDNFIFHKNYEPNRWPSGNPETGYMDTDGGPTKTNLLNANRHGRHQDLWLLSFGKKPTEELYQIDIDPYSMNNLADDPHYAEIKDTLKSQMEAELKAQKDPRMFGKGSVFDKYPYSRTDLANFYERFMKGEKMKTSWIEDSDFEPVEKE